MGSGTSKKKEGKILETLADHEDAITCIAVSDDGSILVTGSDDCTARMWCLGLSETECLGIIKGHQGYIICIAVCDQYVLTGSADSTIRKWDMESCECVFVYTGHKSRISRLICSGDFVFSTSYDGTAKAWLFDAADLGTEDETAKHACIRTFTGHERPVFPEIYIPADDTDSDDSGEVRIHPEDVLITGSFDTTARLWSLLTGKCMRIFRGHKGPIGTMATDIAATTLYTGSGDRTIRSWNIKDASCIKVMEGSEGQITSLLVVNRLIYSSAGEVVRCWAKDFGDCTKTYRGHNHTVHCLSFHEGILFSGSGDTCARAFDAKSGEMKRIFQGHEGSINCMAIVGEKLFTGSADKTLRVWDISKIGCEEDEENLEDNEDSDEDEDGDDYEKENKRLDNMEKRLNDYFGRSRRI